MIFEFETLQSYLAAELRRRVQLNPRYSLRAFARDLRLSPGPLSEVLRGRRDLSLRSIAYVAKAFGLNSAETRHLFHLAQKNKIKRQDIELEASDPALNQKILHQDIFELVAEWHHFAILNLLDCEGFEWKASWIAARLGISRLQAKMAMELLLRLQLVVKRGSKIRGATEQVLSPSDVPSAAVRRYHHSILEKAALALEAQGTQERDFAGCGFAFDPELLPAVKKEIGEFQDRLLAKYARGKKTEVYFLETALFKLTQRSEK